MHVFVDESGIQKQTGHSAFALVFVSVKNDERLNAEVATIENEIGCGAFHWAETKWKHREAFLERILSLEWDAKIGIIGNPIDPEAELERMMCNLLVETRISGIHIDGKKSKRYERRMKKVLRDKGISTKKLKTVNDEAYAGIRIADALAGLFRSYHDDPENSRANRWYEQIRRKKKILVLQ